MTEVSILAERVVFKVPLCVMKMYDDHCGSYMER